MDFDDLDETRTYGIIIYGATGVAGGSMAAHLDALCESEERGELRWAVGGRSSDRLREVAAKCKKPPSVFSASTPEEIHEMAADCQVLVNAAGPYTPHGEDVVAACVEKGTHYVDITGEVAWVAKMVKKYHEAAKEKGVMIVHCAGVMCAPEDIMLYMLAEKLGPLASYKEFIFQSATMGGGTFESGRMELACMDAEDLKLYKDPYCCSAVPEGGPRKEDEDLEQTEQDSDFESLWLTPQHSSHCAHRVVRRTCMLFEQTPSEEEVATALAQSVGAKVLVVEPSLNKSEAERLTAMNRRCADMREASKRLVTMEDALKKGMMPKPGLGPSKEARAMSYCEQIAMAQGKNGDWAYVHMTAPDPGYDLTAMTAVTGALALLEEADALNPSERGGVLTPAFAFHGSAWIEHLQCHTYAEAGGRKPEFVLQEGKPSEETITEALLRVHKNNEELNSKIFDGQIPRFAS